MVRATLTEFRSAPGKYFDALIIKDRNQTDLVVLERKGEAVIALVPYEVYAHLLAQQNWKCPHCNETIADPQIGLRWRVMGNESQMKACPHCGEPIVVSRVPSQLFTVSAPTDAEMEEAEHDYEHE